MNWDRPSPSPIQAQTKVDQNHTCDGEGFLDSRTVVTRELLALRHLDRE